jgi:hypothetical protein
MEGALSPVASLSKRSHEKLGDPFLLSSTKLLQHVCIPVTYSESLPQYNLRRPPQKFIPYRERTAHEETHINWLSSEPGHSFLTQIAYRIALAATPLLALGSAQLTEAQTTILVTTTQQGVTDGSHCSLQEAIYAAEFGSNTALNLTDPDRFYTTGCILQGASGPFTIVLQNTVYSFDTFWDRDAHNPFGLTATPIVFTNITIQGNGATLQWTGSGNSRLFAVGSASIFDTLDNKTVSGTGALRLESVYIKGFRIKGGDGMDGGGGGLGAGGAIYVGTVGSGVPTLDVENKHLRFQLRHWRQRRPGRRSRWKWRRRWSVRQWWGGRRWRGRGRGLQRKWWECSFC